MENVKPDVKPWLAEGGATEQVLEANVAGMNVMQLMMAAADGLNGNAPKYHESVPAAAATRLIIELDRGKTLVDEYVARTAPEVQAYVAALKAEAQAPKPGSKPPKAPKAPKAPKEPEAANAPNAPKESKARRMGAPKKLYKGEGEAAILILDSTANWDDASKSYAIIPGEGSKVTVEASPKQREALGGALTFKGTVTARFEKNKNGHWITVQPDEGVPVATAWKSMYMVQVDELVNGFDPRELPYKEDVPKTTPPAKTPVESESPAIPETPPTAEAPDAPAATEQPVADQAEAINSEGTADETPVQ